MESVYIYIYADMGRRCGEATNEILTHLASQICQGSPEIAGRGCLVVSLVRGTQYSPENMITRL